MTDSSEKKVLQLLSLMSSKASSKAKSELLNQIETIRGYDLVFILSLITQNNYSGNLIIVNEANDLSSITFIYGDIVKVDYPDQLHLLGNLVVENEILSKYEMQEIMSKCGVARLGDYLIEHKYLTPAQLRKILFKQTHLRLSKYLTDLNIRIKFNFDGESSDSVLINKMDYLDILHNWIFKSYKEEWLIKYQDYYVNSAHSFSSNLGASDFTTYKDFEDLHSFVLKISQAKNSKLTYHDLFGMAQTTRVHLTKSLHFLVLAGVLSLNKNKERIQIEQQKSNKTLLENLEKDLKITKQNLLQKKYYEAFGVLNQYSLYMMSNPVLHFYFIWIKLIGVYEHNHIIEAEKISNEFNSIDSFQINPGEYHYVKALLFAIQQKYKESDEMYEKAVSYDKDLSKHPINRDDTFVSRILKFFNRLNIDKKAELAGPAQEGSKKVESN